MARPIASVTGFAANTSLGDAITAFAAARAGLSRPSALDGDAFDQEDGPVPVIGCSVPTVAGFHGEARLLSLAMPALMELLETAHLDQRENVGFFVAVPDLQARAKVLEAELAPPLGLLNRLARMTELAAPAPLQRAFPSGPAGFAQAIEAGLDLLAKGQARACVVGGIDTLCDPLALDMLAAQQRLKIAENPIGLRPGEAAAFLLLESPTAAPRNGVTPYATVMGTAVAREPPRGDDPPAGEGLTKVIEQLVAESGPLPAGETWFVLDVNGEVTRAQDWGCCHARLAAQMPGTVPAPEWAPAISFGDTGAASAALGVQMVIRAFSRRYAPGRCAVVVSSSDDGQRAAIRIEQAN